MTRSGRRRAPGHRPFHVHDVTVTGPQLLALIVVPIITVGLWWLLGHTRFGEAVRASATNADLARLTGISPKLDVDRDLDDRRLPLGDRR